MPQKLLVGDEGLKYYIQLWKSIKRSFFKLETLQTYATSLSPGWEEFQRGDMEELRSRLREMLGGDPARPYQKLKDGRVKFQRVHIVQVPLSEYLWYEIESYRISTELGEEILFVTQKEANNIDVPVPLRDFLMFDDETVILHNFTATGEFQGSELLEGEDEVGAYVQLKQALLERGVPLEEFLENQGMLT